MIESIPLWEISLSAELSDPASVERLAESMREVGLIHPVSVVARDNAFQVVKGLGNDRCRAAGLLGWTHIDADVIPVESDEDGLRVEMRSIDETLCRKKVSPAEEAILTARRKEIYETLHPDTKRGVAGGKARNGTTANSAVAGFAEDQAAGSGRSARSVYQAQARGGLGAAALEKITGTCLDKGEELDALLALPEDKRDALIARAVAGEKVSAKPAVKQQARDLREIELAGRQQALPDKRYGVIACDAPWRTEVYSRETGLDRSADNHYATMTVEEIAGLPVADIAADDCVIFFWTTIPFLREAMRVLTAWGFEYKSSAVWVKDVAGTGYWFRQQHEILLVATRGHVPAPAPGTQWSSVIDARRGKHSEKPAAFYELIETYFPHLPKIELFARAARPNWSAWGLEAPAEDSVAEGIDGDGALHEDHDPGEAADDDEHHQNRRTGVALRDGGVGTGGDEGRPGEVLPPNGGSLGARERPPHEAEAENGAPSGLGDGAVVDPFAGLTIKKPRPSLPSMEPGAA